MNVENEEVLCIYFLYVFVFIHLLTFSQRVMCIIQDQNENRFLPTFCFVWIWISLVNYRPLLNIQLIIKLINTINILFILWNISFHCAKWCFTVKTHNKSTCPGLLVTFHGFNACGIKKRAVCQQISSRSWASACV